MRITSSLIGMVLVLWSASGVCTPLSVVQGPAIVVDGDTLRVSGVRVRFDSIDAPEVHQSCLVGTVVWRCGQQAKAALENWVAGRNVVCAKTGEDMYGRMLASCTVAGEKAQDWMVRNGWAFAFRKYSLKYLPQEQAARRKGVGLWVGRFLYPWTWRACSKPFRAPTGCSTAWVSRSTPWQGSDSTFAALPSRVVKKPVHFASCADARAHNAAPVRRGDPGYGPHLDRDDDGVGCEPFR